MNVFEIKPGSPTKNVAVEWDYRQQQKKYIRNICIHIKFQGKMMKICVILCLRMIAICGRKRNEHLRMKSCAVLYSKRNFNKCHKMNDNENVYKQKKSFLTTAKQTLTHKAFKAFGNKKKSKIFFPFFYFHCYRISTLVWKWWKRKSSTRNE